MGKDNEDSVDAPPKAPKYPKGHPKNPLGLGDPEDLSLRRVERDVMIPMKMRDKAKEEKCIPEVSAFTECCKSSSVAMVIKCREENTNLKACLGRWYNDKEFQKMCEDEYLKERSEYRRTGVKKALKKYIVN